MALLLTSMNGSALAESRSERVVRLSREYELRAHLDREFQVASASEYIRMTDYYESRYGAEQATNEFNLPGGALVQCHAVAAESRAVSPPPTPDVSHSGRDLAAGFGLDGSRDVLGRIRRCEQGTYPVLVPDRESWFRFPSLNARFAKTGHASSLGDHFSDTARPSYCQAKHEYAVTRQTVAASGAYGDLNLWSPYVQGTYECDPVGGFSLSQVWLVNLCGGVDERETLEAGWQVFPYLYGDSRPHLFIYHTTRGYQDGSGCYNLECDAFVQTDNSVLLGGELAPVSEAGAPIQYYFGVQYQLNDDRSGWWLGLKLKFNGTDDEFRWVGYFRSDIFDRDCLRSGTTWIDFGGEIINDHEKAVNTTTDMGSGAQASAGWSRAAYIKKMEFVDASDTWHSFDSDIQAFLGGYVDDPGRYALDDNTGLFSRSADPDWGSYIYFGGAGNSNCPNVPEPDVRVSQQPIAAGKPPNSIPIRLDWSEVPSTTSYDVEEISERSDGTWSEVPSGSWSVTGTSLSVERIAQSSAPQTYLYHVRPRNVVTQCADGLSLPGGWRPARPFALCAAAPAPVIDSAVLSGSSATLSWRPVVGAETYEIQYSTDPAFPNSPSAYAKATQVNMSISAGALFYFRVRALTSCGQQPWRGVWSLTRSAAAGTSTRRRPSRH